MEFEKLLGWLAFLGGVSIILFSLYSSYNIFTKKQALPEFFVFEEKKTAALQGGGLPGQEQITQMISQQMENLFPADSISMILNLLIWSILAGILIFGGSQIAGLGIKMLKIKKE